MDKNKSVKNDENEEAKKVIKKVDKQGKKVNGKNKKINEAKKEKNENQKKKISLEEQEELNNIKEKEVAYNIKNKIQIKIFNIMGWTISILCMIGMLFNLFNIKYGKQGFVIILAVLTILLNPFVLKLIKIKSRKIKVMLVLGIIFITLVIVGGDPKQFKINFNLDRELYVKEAMIKIPKEWKTETENKEYYNKVRIYPLLYNKETYIDFKAHKIESIKDNMVNVVKYKDEENYHTEYEEYKNEKIEKDGNEIHILEAYSSKYNKVIRTIAIAKGDQLYTLVFKVGKIEKELEEILKNIEQSLVMNALKIKVDDNKIKVGDKVKIDVVSTFNNKIEIENIVSSDEKILKVENNEIIGVEQGKAEIKVTTKEGLEDKLEFKVYIPANSIKINEDLINLNINEEKENFVQILPENVKFELEEEGSEKILEIKDNKIKALKYGETIIVAKTLDNKEYKSKVVVKGIVPDFKNLNKEAKTWGKENNVTITLDYKYSDQVPKEQVISQSIEAGKEIKDNKTEIKVVYSWGKIPTRAEKNALEKAKIYSKSLHMSKQGIFDQLTSQYGEKFTREEAQYAIDNLVADYNKNALEKAKIYSEKLNMSKRRIFDQLISRYGEKFTREEAQYAIDNL